MGEAARCHAPRGWRSGPMTEVLIIGAGPAGLAAARRAIEARAPVTIVDDNPAPGGQIWRALPIPSEWTSKPVTIYGGKVVAVEPDRVTVETFDGVVEVRPPRLTLATGARASPPPSDG